MVFRLLGMTTNTTSTNTTSTMNLSKLSIAQIAYTIQREWKKVHFAAQPYLNAMKQVYSIEDIFMADDVRSIVIYFLGNASGFRGATAKAIKAELKRRAKIK